MLLGTEIGAALTALEPLGIDFIGLNCATGPAEMSEHLRHLSRHARIGVSCMPNAGLPELTADGARYPLTPEQLADAHDTSPTTSAWPWSAAAAARRRSTCARSSSGSAAASSPPRRPRPEAGVAVALPARAVPPGHVLPVDRRADQRQRLQGVPRRHARRALGRLRRDRPRPDPRRRAPARPLHRLRRPRRRRRHARGRLPVRHRVDPAARARLDRAGGDRGRAGAARWPRGRSTRSTTRTATGPTRASAGSCRSSRSTAPRWSR